MTFNELQHELERSMNKTDRNYRKIISGLINDIKQDAFQKGITGEIPEKIVDAAIIKKREEIKDIIDNCLESNSENLTKYKHLYTIINKFPTQLITDPREIAMLILRHSSQKNLPIVKANRSVFMEFLRGKVEMETAKQIFDGIIKE